MLLLWVGRTSKHMMHHSFLQTFGSWNRVMLNTCIKHDIPFCVYLSNVSHIIMSTNQYSYNIARPITLFSPHHSGSKTKEVNTLVAIRGLWEHLDTRVMMANVFYPFFPVHFTLLKPFQYAKQSNSGTWALDSVKTTF